MLMLWTNYDSFASYYAGEQQRDFHKTIAFYQDRSVGGYPTGVKKCYLCISRRDRPAMTE
jgi:hypothetical protein